MLLTIEYPTIRIIESICIGNRKKLGSLCQKGVKVLEESVEKRSCSDMAEGPEKIFRDTNRNNSAKALQPFLLA